MQGKEQGERFLVWLFTLLTRFMSFTANNHIILTNAEVSLASKFGVVEEAEVMERTPKLELV